MTDFAIRFDGDKWILDLDEGDGDLTLTHTQGRAAEVGQRVVFRLLIHRGECPYDVTAGIPYVGGIFGATPVEGVGGLLTAEIAATEGVDEILGTPTYDLDDRTLSIGVEIRVGDSDVLLELGVSP